MTVTKERDAKQISIADLKRLLETHPHELRQLLDADSSAIYDKFGRLVKVPDKVTTPDGEEGMVIRLDRKSKRVLIKLDDGRTRMLMAHRVEVKRGRPRKLQVAV